MIMAIVLLSLSKKINFFLKELQRRLDQTLGKPGSYLAGIDRVGNLKPMTVGARLYRVEQQLSVMDKKLDQLLHTLNQLAHHPLHSKPFAIQSVNTNATASTSSTAHSSSSTTHHQQHQQQVLPLQLPSAPSQPNSPVPLASIEDDV